jgi:phage tail-like protein
VTIAAEPAPDAPTPGTAVDVPPDVPPADLLPAEAPPADDGAVSSYLAYLPRVFAEDDRSPDEEAAAGPPFLGRFLLAFEAVLSGLPDRPGLQQAVDGIADLLDPATTREDFLPWLASWVGLTLRADWDVPTRRLFIRDIVPLYRLRGTKEGLERMLSLYTGQPVEIDDDHTVPHFFTVALMLPQADPEQVRRIQEIARAIVDQEKPAHTFYALEVTTPTMRLVSLDLQSEETATLKITPPLLVLGQNTLLGVGRAGS